jgi:hypothetical protein
MALDIYGQLTSLTNLLNKNNTNTSSFDVSDGLNKRVQRCFKGTAGLSSDIPTLLDDYPILCVELVTTPEELVSIGNNPKRDVEINYDIIPITHYGASTELTAPQNVEVSHKELINLTSNIHDLIRNNITLSGTVERMEIEGTDWGVSIGEPTVYNQASRIRVKIFKYST